MDPVVPAGRPSSGGTTMVVPPGNEGSDGPQLTSPLPRVAPAPDCTGRSGRPGAGCPRATGRGGSGSGCGPSTGATPPCVDVVLAAGLFVVCSGWVIERTATRPDLWFVAALIFPLVFRRRAPMTVFLVIAAVAFVQWLVTGRPWPTARSSSRSTRWRSSPTWLLVAAAAVILEVGRRHGHGALDADRQRRQVLRLPHRAGLHGAAGRRGGAGAAQPARLAGRARRAAGARARPAGVARRGRPSGPASRGRCTTWSRTTSR